MKLSIIVVTKNRARDLARCLDSIAAAFGVAAPLDGEIVIVDNGSTDNTAAVIDGWARANGVPMQALSQPAPGRSRALNSALRAAKGDVLAFTDDDCQLHPEYVNDLLRHAAADTDLILRGGRIELGDPTDLPFTINTSTTPKRWSRALEFFTNLSADSGRKCSATSNEITKSNLTFIEKSAWRSAGLNSVKEIFFDNSFLSTHSPSMPRMVSAPSSLNARRNVPKPQPTSTTLLGCKTGYNLAAIIRGAIMLKYFSSCEYGTLTVDRVLCSICIVPELTPKWRRLYFSIRSAARGIFQL